MQYHSLAEFLNMGGYAFFVWLAYGVTFGCLAVLIITTLGQESRVLKHIANKMKREERLKQNRGNK